MHDQHMAVVKYLHTLGLVVEGHHSPFFKPDRLRLTKLRAFKRQHPQEAANLFLADLLTVSLVTGNCVKAVLVVAVKLEPRKPQLRIRPCLHTQFFDQLVRRQAQNNLKLVAKLNALLIDGARN
ncbi:hypothetical protein D3C81_1839540 [compost metagenome]